MFDELTEKVSGVFSLLRGQKKLTPTNISFALKRVRLALLEADVNLPVAEKLIANIQAAALGKQVVKGISPEQQLMKVAQDELARIMGVSAQEMDFNRPGPLPVLIVGPNGQGKTTFAGKLAHLLQNQQKKDTLLVPADTFRPAAKEQLQILATQAGVDCFDSDLSLSPQDIARQALKEAQEKHKKAVIIDTAGRLHVDDTLMKQVREIRKSVAHLNPEVLLVADAMAGRQATHMAESFHETASLTGVVLTKIDSGARGGAALSIPDKAGVPIRYLSTGEKMGDLELFHPDRLASRILGQGDVVSLVEKAEAAIDTQEAEKAAKALEKGQLNIDSFLQSLQMMERLGPLTSVAKLVPGLGSALGQVPKGEMEKKARRYKVMASSMTKAERRDHTLVTNSRLERIAKGSGHSLSAVKEFLTQFGRMKAALQSFPTSPKKWPSQLQKKPPKKKRGQKGPWGKSFFQGKKRS